MVFQLRRGGKSTCCATAPGEISTIGLRHPPAKVKDAGEAKCPGLCGKPDELSQSHIKSVSCRRAHYIPPGPACQRITFRVDFILRQRAIPKPLGWRTTPKPAAAPLGPKAI